MTEPIYPINLCIIDLKPSIFLLFPSEFFLVFIWSLFLDASNASKRYSIRMKCVAIATIAIVSS